MGGVTRLDDYRPHNSGPARCLGCGHEWQAVVPADREGCLECPECRLYKGEFAGNCVPPADTEVFACNCGCDQFFVLHHGIFCRGCGSTTNFSDLG